LAPAAQALSLQRAIGNRAATRVLRDRSRARLARWSIPLQGGVPAGTKSTTLADFIDVIKAVEAKFPASEQTNTKLMITRLRKLFYGTPGWDSHLIPGASGVAPVYKVKEVETGRRDWEWDLWPYSLEYVDKRTELDVTAAAGTPEAKLKDPSSIQEVLMPNGDFVDVGHVLAGLDALNYPTAVTAPFGSYKISSNVDAVTWVGDLGSILAEVVFQYLKLGRRLTDPEVQAQVDLMAPVQDMLGNVDAYAIGSAFSISSSAGQKVSEILLDYYGSSASTVGLAARSKRFTTFASQIGLGTFSGGSFANETAWLNKYEVEVGNAAGLYVGAGTHVKAYVNPWGLGGLGGLMAGVSSNPLRRPLVEELLRQLRVKVAAEAVAATAPSTPPTGSPGTTGSTGSGAPTLARQALPIDQQLPPGVTGAPAVDVPAGVNTTDPDQARVVADAALTGGWTDGSGQSSVTTSSGRVGGVDRILLEGITGHQQAQGALAHGSAGSGPGFASTVGAGARGQRGRAVALVPRSLRTGPAGPIGVVVHFHGVLSGSSGMRSRGDNPEDVADFQLPQQLEAFAGAHAGTRLIVLMPIGITTENASGSHGTDFGLTNVDTFVSDCFTALGSELPQGATPGPVYLSAHSGGGLYVSMLLSTPSRLPANFAGMFGFESWHNDVGTWESYLTDRLNKELKELERLRSNTTATDDQIAAAQLAYLRDHGFRFVGFGGSGGASGYAGKARHLRQTIIDWFTRSQPKLAAATGGHADVLAQLWANFQANFFAGSTHMNALSKDDNFARALGSALGTIPTGTAPAPAGTGAP
jgi:hypothetical protein